MVFIQHPDTIESLPNTMPTPSDTSAGTSAGTSADTSVTTCVLGIPEESYLDTQNLGCDKHVIEINMNNSTNNSSSSLNSESLSIYDAIK